MIENNKSKTDDSDQIFSKSSYTTGETTVGKSLSDMIGAKFTELLNKALLYLISTILGGISVVVWNMNSKISELSGKYSNPDKTIETISIRLETLEKKNSELLQENYNLRLESLNSKLEKK